MVVKCLNRKGFTLAEALISMFILSIFFLAATKVITQKQTENPVDVASGFFECVDGKYDYNGGAAIDGCKFRPPSNAAYFTVYVFEGDAVYEIAEPFSNKSIDGGIDFGDSDGIHAYLAETVNLDEDEGMQAMATRTGIKQSYSNARIGDNNKDGMIIIW